MSSSPVLEPVDQVIRGIQSLPWAMHAVVGVAFITGIVLWLTGRRFLRPATVIVGCAFGAAAGFVMLPVLMPTSGASPYLGLGIGVAIGLLAGLLLYKAATAMTFGSVLGAGCALIAAAVVTAPIGGYAAAAAMDDQPGRLGGEETQRHLRPVTETDDEPEPRVNPSPTDLERPVIRPNPKRDLRPVRPEPPKINASPDPRPRSAETRPAPPAPTAPKTVAKRQEPKAASKPATKNANEPAAPKVAIEDPTARTAPKGATLLTPEKSPDLFADGQGSEQARAFWGALKNESSKSWEAVPVGGRIWVTAAGLTGLALGTIMGFMLPMWAAGALTALVGSAIWLPSGVWLAHAAGVPAHDKLSLSPMGWAVVWLIVALLGMAAQWRGLIDTGGPKAGKSKRKAKKPADDEDEDEE